MYALTWRTGRQSGVFRMSGAVLTPLAAGPFGVLAEGEYPIATGETRPSHGPLLLLFGPNGTLAWRRPLSSGRLTPLLLVWHGHLALFLRPNAPAVVWG